MYVLLFVLLFVLLLIKCQIIVCIRPYLIGGNICIAPNLKGRILPEHSRNYAIAHARQVRP